MCCSECKVVTTGLVSFALWLFVGLPFVYASDPAHIASNEILGVNPGEWLIAIATAILAWTTWKLVKGADRNAAQQLRAYVFVRSPSITNLTTGNVDVDITIPIKNSGQTPAYDLSIRAEIETKDFPSPVSAFTLPTEGIDNLTLGPGSKYFYEFSIDALTPAELAALQNKTKAVFIRGEIKYRDAFGEPHFSNFFLIKGGPYTLVGDSLFVLNEGNSSD
jgi:hypothetical protein